MGYLPSSASVPEVLLHSPLEITRGRKSYRNFLAVRFRVRIVGGQNCKLKGLRHWLRSSRQLLRGSQQRGDMHRHSPLMRSPLSQFQTPAHPRRSSRFFRVWSSNGLPRCTGSPSLLRTGKILFKPTLSAVDGSYPNILIKNVNAAFRCSL